MVDVVVEKAWARVLFSRSVELRRRRSVNISFGSDGRGVVRADGKRGATRSYSNIHFSEAPKTRRGVGHEVAVKFRHLPRSPWITNSVVNKPPASGDFASR